MDVYFQTAVGDNRDRLLAVLDVAKKRSDLIILCGGLGPTEDDLTKQTLAEFLGRKLIVESEAMEKLDAFFASRPIYKRTANNDRQAYIVEGSQPLPNRTGLAVGGVVEQEGVTYVVLPGPPSELKPMVQEQLCPLLAKGQRLYSRVLRFFGIGESQLVTVLSDVIDQQTDPTIAPYAKTGEVTLRLSTKAASDQEAMTKLDQFETEILSYGDLAQFMYGYGEDNSLSQQVFELLEARKETLTAAESLTAGLFQATLAGFAGASQIFSGGFVTYSLEQKAQMLGIAPEGLEVHGMVSSWTAEKMAYQARKLVGSDYGLSLTGVAGPGELDGYPPGTVFIGLSTKTQTKAYQVQIGDRGRQHNRQIAVLHALNLVRQTLLNDGVLV